MLILGITSADIDLGGIYVALSMITVLNYNCAFLYIIFSKLYRNISTLPVFPDMATGKSFNKYCDFIFIKFRR